MTDNVDVLVFNGGSVFLFQPCTVPARDWIEEKVDSPMWYGQAIAVEHRYARDLAQAMMDDGLSLQ